MDKLKVYLAKDGTIFATHRVDQDVPLEAYANFATKMVIVPSSEIEAKPEGSTLKEGWESRVNEDGSPKAA